MTFEIPKEIYKGAVNRVVLGVDPASVTIGGETAPQFHRFEGLWPHPPVLAMEVYDQRPVDWVDEVIEPFEDVLGDPVTWAQKCVDSFGAEAICLQLHSIDPIEGDTSPEVAAALAGRVAESIQVPLIVYGTGAEDKDASVLAEVAKVCRGRNLFLGPVVAKNYEPIARAAQEHGHGVIIQTAVNLPQAKELNSKVGRILPQDKILFDPISPALGYGLEYGYSVMEREKLAGLSFGDDNLKMPLVANIGQGCWDTKEAKASRTRGLLWETLTCMSFLLAGANLFILRHPESLRVINKIIQDNLRDA